MWFSVGSLVIEYRTRLLLTPAGGGALGHFGNITKFDQRDSNTRFEMTNDCIWFVCVISARCFSCLSVSFRWYSTMAIELNQQEIIYSYMKKSKSNGFRVFFKKKDTRWKTLTSSRNRLTISPFLPIILPTSCKADKKREKEWRLVLSWYLK